MKLLYAREKWSFVGLPDTLPLAPFCRMMLKGFRLLIGLPITSAAAKVRGAQEPLTLTNLCHCMVEMEAEEFHKAGGWWCVVGPGDAIWVPPMNLIGEFNIPDPRQADQVQVSESVAWAALSRYHCTEEFCENVTEGLQFLLTHACCHPSAKTMEDDFKAGYWLNHVLSVLLRCVSSLA